MFAELYKKTTDPETTYNDILSEKNVYFSILFHTVAYSVAVYLFALIVLKHRLTYDQLRMLVIFFVLVMFFGYFGRLWRVKQLYKIHNNKEKIAQIIANGYFCWYFIG